MDAEVDQRMQEEERTLKSTLQREPAETRQSRGDEDDQEEEQKEDFYSVREESNGRDKEEEDEEQNKVCSR